METRFILFREEPRWLEQAAEVLDGTAPDYLVISHMEPDHAAAFRLWRNAIRK